MRRKSLRPKRHQRQHGMNRERQHGMTFLQQLQRLGRCRDARPSCTASFSTDAKLFSPENIFDGRRGFSPYLPVFVAGADCFERVGGMHVASTYTSCVVEILGSV
ncbi:unnamed protein product [Ectocarpus sp. 12 AP-2014]